MFFNFPNWNFAYAMATEFFKISSRICIVKILVGKTDASAKVLINCQFNDKMFGYHKLAHEGS